MKKSENAQRREYRLFKIAKWASRIMPFWLLQLLGRTVGVVFFLLSWRRRIVLTNLRHVFPGRSRSWRLVTALRCGAHFGRIAFDYLKWCFVPAEVVRRKVTIEGMEHLHAALAQGKGVLVMSAHFGLWEVAAMRIGLEGLPQALVHRPLDNAYIEAEVAAGRTRFGNTLIAKNGAIKGMTKKLRAGGIVDLLIDQKPDRDHFVVVNFLGVPTPITPSLARLAVRYGSPVVPFSSWPEGTGYGVRLGPPIIAKPEDNEMSLMQAYADWLSEMIRNKPHLWLWFHDRWQLSRRRREKEIPSDQMPDPSQSEEPAN